MKISLLLTTRQRPKLLDRFISSATGTAADIANLEIVVRMDNDDPELKKLNMVLDKHGNVEIIRIAGDRPDRLGNNWNECWKAASGEIFQLCGDDITYETHGWDRIIRNEFLKFDDRIVLVYGKDSERCACTHPWVHKNWTDTVGYFVPEGQIFCNDTWLEYLARRIKRISFLPAVKTPHKVGFDASTDPVWRKMWDDKKRFDDRGKYDAKEPQRILDAGKLAQFIETFQKESNS
jgi:glycosyltransferase involved in cell wall biosynthesis